MLLPPGVPLDAFGLPVVVLDHVSQLFAVRLPWHDVGLLVLSVEQQVELATTGAVVLTIAPLLWSPPDTFGNWRVAPGATVVIDHAAPVASAGTALRLLVVLRPDGR